MKSAHGDFVKRSFVFGYLKHDLPSLVVATTFALGLGVTAASVGALSGLAFQVLSATGNETLRFEQTFGPSLGPLAAWILGRDGVSSGELMRLLPQWLIVLAGAKALFGLVQWYLWERAGERAALTMRADLVDAFLRLDPAQRREGAALAVEADLSSTVTTDVRMLREYIVHFYGGLPREALQIVFTTATLIALSPKLTAIFFLAVAPTAAVVSKIGRKLRKRARAALEDSSSLTEWLQQRLLGIETIKHYRTEGLEDAKMVELGTELHRKFQRAARVKARTSPAMEAFAVIALGAVLVVALGDVAAERATGAQLFWFFSSLALMSQAGAKLGKYLNSNREGAAAVDRLRHVLDSLRAHRRGEGFVGEGERLAFANVSVQYPGTKAKALADFSFTFAPGKIYCLVGPSGAGKSTVFGAALGLIRPQSGTVAAPKALLSMPQQVRLAPASLAANVAYPDASWDAARIDFALARVGLANVTRELPEAQETLVGEGGRGVSGGQAQRILLARLHYRRAPVVLVDEGTSALDPEVEILVHGLLRELADAGATVIAIAHRPSAAAIADEVLLLDGGRLVASGTLGVVERTALFQRLMR